MSTVKLQSVYKKFKKRPILIDVNLDIREQEIVGIVGGNGSGKTTILRILSGLMYADQGKTFVHGKEILRGHFPADIGLLIEMPRFIEKLTGFENLQLLARIQNKITDEEIRAMMQSMMLDSNLQEPVQTYSLGMNQKLGLVQAFMEKPKLLLLDEPTSALDEESRQRFHQLLLDSRDKGASVVLVSHDKEEIAQLCDRVYVLAEGKLKEVASV